MLKKYNTDEVRNVAIIGHGGTGKSTLFEAMLYIGGKTNNMGSASAGTLVSDFHDDEKAKKISIKSSLGFVEYDDKKINIIDTPGTSDFIGETRTAIEVADLAILVVDSVDGVQIETEKSWRFLKEKNIPRIIFVNKMDKDRASYSTVITNLKDSLGVNVATLCVPDAEGSKFGAVLDTIEMKMYRPKPGTRDVEISDIPSDLLSIARDERGNLVELSAESDDELIEKFLEGDELTDEEIRGGIRTQLREAKLTPVICGSSEGVIGIKNLLKVISSFAPKFSAGKEIEGYSADDSDKIVTVKSGSESDFSAVVWKTSIDQYAGRFNYIKVISGTLMPDSEIFNSTKSQKERVGKLYTMEGGTQCEVPSIQSGDIGVIVKLEKTTTLDTICDSKLQVVLPLVDVPHPVFSYAVEASRKGDDDKIGQFLQRASDEDPTVTYEFNSETGETVLSGMGEMHLNLILDNLREKTKLDVITRVPRVAYRETITKNTEAHYKHKKQSGGHGQYGEVSIRVKPVERGQGFQFKDSIVGGVVPKQFIPGVEKGLIEGMTQGILAKYPVVDVSVELYDGSYHSVDSSEMAFKIAARHALKIALENGSSQLLEPVMNVDIYSDKDYMGDIMSDITSRRGRVLGMDSRDDSSSSVSVIKAQIPQSEMLRYSTDLRSMTSGKATFEMSFSHYAPLSGKEAEKVISERAAEEDH